MSVTSKIKIVDSDKRNKRIQFKEEPNITFCNWRKTAAYCRIFKQRSNR